MAQPALPIVIQAIDRATSVLAKVRAEVAATANSVDAANARMGKGTARAGAQASAGSRAMTAGFVAAGVAMIGSAFAAGKFNFSLQRTGVFANATAEELQSLRRALLEGTKELQILPQEAAATAEQLAKVGLSTKDITKVVIPTLELMIAAGKELGPKRAAKVMFQGMTLFGKSADQAREVAAGLAATFAGSALDANKLSVGFQILATGTTRLRGSFEDTSAILGLIANIFPDRINRGVRSAARLFEDLSISTRRHGFEAAFGVRVLDKQGTGFRRVRDIVTDVTEVLLNLNPVQRAARIEQSRLSIESQRALGFFVDLAKAGIPDAMGELKKGSQVFKVFGDRIETQVKTGGTLDKLQEAMATTLPDAMKKLGGAFQRVGIAFGTKIGPVLIKFLGALTTVLNAVAAAIENTGPAWSNIIGWAGTLLSIMLGFKAVKGIGRLLGGLVLGRGAGALIGRGAAAAGAAGGGALGTAAATGAGVAAPGLIARGLAKVGITGARAGAVGGFIAKRALPVLAIGIAGGAVVADLVGLRESARTGRSINEVSDKGLFSARAARAIGIPQGVIGREEKVLFDQISNAMSDILGEETDIPGIPNQPGPARVEALLTAAQGPEGLGGLISTFLTVQAKRDAAEAERGFRIEVDREAFGRLVRDLENDQFRAENGARFNAGF